MCHNEFQESRRKYIIRLSALVANERHLEQDLEVAINNGHRIYVERSLERTRSAIEALHTQYIRTVIKSGHTERGHL